ncbi:GTP-binding protein [Glutamicibacter sp.]|uniref:GTP-binding protein n=1 Tax=Glutamicibacter sp. TaxID=1931995 RepID=UPI003D6B1324
MNLIVLSALDTSSRDSGLSHLRRHHRDAIILRYDFVDGNRLVRHVAGSAAAEHAETVLGHPCIGCATKFEILPTIQRLAPEDSEATMILGLPATWHSGTVLEMIGTKLEPLKIQIGSIALALDPAELEDQMWDRHSLWESGFNAMEHDERTSGEFFFTELMQADTLIPVEGLETQLLESASGPRRAGGTDYEAGLELARQMAPHAQVCVHEEELGSFHPAAARKRTSAGHMPRAAIDAGNAPIRLQAERPLHPERFRQALPSLAESCTCIRGILWVASALSERVAIGGAGPRIWMENTGAWNSNIAVSELLLYGSEHEASQIETVFEQCQVTEEELKGLFSSAHREGGEWHES